MNWKEKLDRAVKKANRSLETQKKELVFRTLNGTSTSDPFDRSGAVSKELANWLNDLANASFTVVPFDQKNDKD
jgi:hypothetical protein